MHVPLIVRYPARFAPKRSEAMIDVGVDLMPTLLDLCGIDIPEEIHGESYLSVLDGASDSHRDTIWFQVFAQENGAPGEFTPYAQRGIRNGAWLYVRHKDKRVMLFDQRADPDELNNLVEDPQYLDLMDKFDARIAAHMSATGDNWDMAADFPPPDFMTHAEAKTHLENVLLPRAIEVP